MITADEARRISEDKYISVFNEIERAAHSGSHEYCYMTTTPIPSDLYIRLVDNGYKVLFKEEEVCDEDHYGKDIPDTKRTVYYNIISWW